MMNMPNMELLARYVVSMNPIKRKKRESIIINMLLSKGVRHSQS